MPDLSWFIKSLDLGLRIWLGLTLASAVLLFGPTWGLSFLSAIPPTVTPFAQLALVVFGCLSAISILAFSWRGVELTWGFVSKRIAKAQYRKAAAKSLDDLTKRERDILAFLVTNGERHFTTDVTGGFAASLIGRGLIVRAIRPGQAIDQLVTPFSVDEAVWKALQQRKDEFEHPEPDGRPPYVDSPW